MELPGVGAMLMLAVTEGLTVTTRVALPGQPPLALVTV